MLGRERFCDAFYFSWTFCRQFTHRFDDVRLLQSRSQEGPPPRALGPCRDLLFLRSRERPVRHLLKSIYVQPDLSRYEPVDRPAKLDNLIDRCLPLFRGKPFGDLTD